MSGLEESSLKNLSNGFLYTWIKNQKKNYLKDDYSDEKIKKLELIEGWIWH